MWFCGIPVRNDLVTVLARMLEDTDAHDTAHRLHKAVANGQAVAALAIADRMAILAVLADPPERLEELRGVLLNELDWWGRKAL